ncbi:hypothetical protein BKA80DRAFT_269582 [Phyllosticta citrichinensis]
MRWTRPWTAILMLKTPLPIWMTLVVRSLRRIKNLLFNKLQRPLLPFLPHSQALQVHLYLCDEGHRPALATVLETAI